MRRKSLFLIVGVLFSYSPVANAYRDLETDTFLTRDPIGYADGPNVYCYVHCNPINKFDSLGLASGFWNKAKEVVIGLLTLGPIDSYDAATGDTADTARSFAGEMGEQHSDGTPKNRSDIVNATRHATWQAVLTQKHGAKDAETVGDLHELGEDATNPADSAKDRHNNSVGRAIGETTKTPEEAQKKVEEALLNGELMVDDPEATPAPAGADSSGSQGSSSGDSSSGSSSGDSSGNSSDGSGDSSEGSSSGDSSDLDSGSSS